MAEVANIPLVDLLIDVDNPRLAQSASSQQEAYLELADQQGDRLIRLAADIVDHGLDPTNFPAVVATADARKRYRVLEGNRRVLALRALETPALIDPVLSPANKRRLVELSKRYSDDPVDPVPCVLFATEEEAQHWVRLRHTGENLGVGTVAWGRDEQDRYHARHGTRRPASQVLEFVEKHGALSDESKASKRRITTTLQRMLETASARQQLGVDVVDKQVVALYPTDVVAGALTHFIEDLKLGRIGVPDLYHVKDRERYVAGLPSSVRPKKSTRLRSPVLLDDLTAGTVSPGPPPRSSRARRKSPPAQTTVIPKGSTLNVPPPRINTIYNELLSLNAELYPNACSVLLRVFIELSVDHHLEQRKLMTDKELREKILAKRLKAVAADLAAGGKISAKLQRAIDMMADGNRSMIGASLPTFNQYVHNQYVFPRAADLYTTWNEVAPLMDQLWP